MIPTSISPLYFYSFDGYVRVPGFMLSRLTLTHLSSGLDQAVLTSLRAEAIETLGAGYTEWQGVIDMSRDTPGPTITLSWDWYIDEKSLAFQIAWGDVRSNLMAVDCRGADLGMVSTVQALRHRLTALDWPHTVAATVPLKRGNQRLDFSAVHRH
ncbi:protein of unknown function [Paraburkholderia fungorum]|uniref:DUF4902 domain-containing protein n=1 Tax=Paraburkholderia fungorum TaxID=134537 RepID=A0A1H1H8S1_9BURK|nr:DUF4902 domain-containing protein [Paraburkholderia fungorum]SDR21844.1 protein of unknown function [Paraburkholderia fungorum]